MKISTVIAAAILVAMPSIAAASNTNFVGPRIEATAGIVDVTSTKVRNLSDVAYGVNAGVDVPVGTNFIVGAEVFTDNVVSRDRTIGVTGRVGYAVSNNVMVYAKAGYANYRAIDLRSRASALDGVTVGGGLEVALNRNVYVKAEYRYSDFTSNGQIKTGLNQGSVGVGLRF